MDWPKIQDKAIGVVVWIVGALLIAFTLWAILAMMETTVNG